MQINVFELIDYNENVDPKSCIQQIYKSTTHRPDVVNLLLIRDENKFHYVYIKSLNRLFSYSKGSRSK